MLSLYFALIVVVSSAPSPYHHVIETPTSRVEQSLIFSPRLQESYQVKKQDIAPFSNFQMPKQQVVYYYEHPQHGQQPVQLYGVRQETAWWQDLWSQIMGQAQGQGESESEGTSEETSESSEIPEESNKITTPLKDLSLPLKEPTSLKQDSINEEAVVVESVFTTESPQESSQVNVIADDLESVRIDAAFRTASKQEEVENYSVEKTKAKVDSNLFEVTTERVEIAYAEISATSTKHEEETSLTTSNPLRADKTVYRVSHELEHQADIFDKKEVDNIAQEKSCRNGKEVPSAMHHIYSIDNQYYVVRGSPKFYGNFEPRSLMFSLQELQPVMRNDDYIDDNAKLQDVASHPMALKETSPAFMINVVDSEDEETRKVEDNVEPEQKMSARSNGQNSNVLVKEEKRNARKESSAEARSISDDSSIAQAKPSGIAIAGVGGVASSKPVANAVSGQNGLSVASPSATAVAGDFLLDDEDRKQKVKARRPQRQPAFDVNL